MGSHNVELLAIDSFDVCNVEPHLVKVPLDDFFEDEASVYLEATPATQMNVLKVVKEAGFMMADMIAGTWLTQRIN
jgi:hypothetical protein